MTDVFISYCQASPGPAKGLAETLQGKGYDIWWDSRLNAGDRFDDVIREKLDEADAVLVVWTTDATRSKYVMMEAGIALAWEKLVPVRVADLPIQAIPTAFRSLQTEDVTDIERIERALQARGVRPQRADRRKPLSREELISELARIDASLPTSVDAWLRRCQNEGFRIVAKRSLMIKATIPNYAEVNFGTLFPDGTLQTNYISESSERLGDPSIAAEYLDGLARLIEGGSVRRDGTSWNWRVEVYGQLPKVSSLLARSDDWLALMKRTRERFARLAAAASVRES